jgi:hypothetical protein
LELLYIGISFQTKKDGILDDLDNFADLNGTIGILADGNEVRDVPGPQGLPIADNYYEVYLDHLGSHQRPHGQYGPVFSDPKVAGVCFGESGFWSKKITKYYRLYGIKDPMADVFLSDSDEIMDNRSQVPTSGTESKGCLALLYTNLKHAGRDIQYL